MAGYDAQEHTHETYSLEPIIESCNPRRVRAILENSLFNPFLLHKYYNEDIEKLVVIEGMT